MVRSPGLFCIAILALAVAVPSHADDAAASDTQAAPATQATGMSALMPRAVAWLIGPATDPSPIATIATAQPLARGKRVDADELANRFTGAQVLASVAYDRKPTTLASDVSEQLKNVESVAASILAPLLVDDAKKTRANEVAGNWAGELLEATDDDAIGACVLWWGDGENKSVAGDASTGPRLILCLFRGQRLPGSNELLITRIAWGDPADLMK
jgi:hypothetical protein